MPTDDGVTRSRHGGISVSLASPDGRVVGGSLAGLLVAAGPVQVQISFPCYEILCCWICLSFLSFFFLADILSVVVYCEACL